MDSISLGIVMPALNEEKNITDAVKSTLAAFDEYKLDGEIVVINDGSVDQTQQIVTKLQKSDKRIHLINHDSPHGIGASFWDGVSYTQKKIVCMLPGDNENDPGEIMRYCQLLEHVDIVIPFVFNKEKRSFFRNAVSWIYRFIINLTFLVNFNYTNGTILYRKSILSDVSYRSRNFFFQTDILVRMVKKGYLFAEVPYRLGLRNTGVSKAVSFPSFFQVVRGYIRLFVGIYYSVDRKKGRQSEKNSLTTIRYNAIPISEKKLNEKGVDN